MGNSETRTQKVSKTNDSTINRNSSTRFVNQVTTPNHVARTVTVNSCKSAAIPRNPVRATKPKNTSTRKNDTPTSASNVCEPCAPPPDLNGHVTPSNFGNSSTPYNPYYNAGYQTHSTHVHPPNYGLYPVLPHNFAATTAANPSESWWAECMKMKQLPQIQTELEFSVKWSSWKQQFLELMIKADATEKHKSQWGDMFLNLIGPIGKIIVKSLRFSNDNEKQSIGILLQKFDSYFIFDTRTRHAREDIYKYISDLKSRTQHKMIEDGDAAVKKKIVFELNQEQFTETACTLIPSFTFSSDFKKLTLKEITFIWELSERNSLKKEKEKWNNYIVDCKNCGGDHVANECKALGKQCARCNGSDHYERRCPKTFVHDCIYCGGSHPCKRCPSYGDVCTNCNKTNHFSWKCRTKWIPNCRFCGMSHNASRNECPAKDSYCVKCNGTGHFIAKCPKNNPRRQ